MKSQVVYDGYEDVLKILKSLDMVEEVHYLNNRKVNQEQRERNESNPNKQV